MKAEIVSVGTELLVGEILNTNSKFISQKLIDYGIDLFYQTTVGDNKDRLINVLDIAFSRVDMVITTGGLGPTVDDLTKETITEYFGKKLVKIDSYYKKLLNVYKRRGFELVGGAEKETSIMEGSEIIENNVGIAPGFYYTDGVRTIVVLPGPPREMEPMLDENSEKIFGNFSNDTLVLKTIELKGIPEGTIDDKLKNFFEMKNPTVAPYVKEKSVHVRVGMKGLKTEKEYLNQELNKLIEKIIEIFPDGIVLD